jgi:predicted nucleic acid-binding protein
MTAINRCFVDSNVWIYAATQSKDNPPDPRHATARRLLESIEPCLSVQVVNEVFINLIRKFNFDEGRVQQLIRSFYNKYVVYSINQDILLRASDLRLRYRLSFWDSLIVSVAVFNQCRSLYTEDMGNGIVIDDNLTIINPFL